MQLTMHNVENVDDIMECTLKKPIEIIEKWAKMKGVIYLINVKNSQGKRFHFYSIIVWHLFEYLSNMLIISACVLL